MSQATQANPSPPRHTRLEDFVQASAGENLAVIYVHGMGDQWRLSDPTSLVNNLETYLRELTPDQQAPYSLNTTPYRCTLPSGEEHAYLTVTLPSGQSFDLHEVYWAPASPAASATDVVKWLQSQLLVPCLRLNAPWGALRGLRFMALGQAIETGRIRRQVVEDKELLDTYQQFSEQTPAGTLGQFLELQPDKDAQAVTKEWNRQSRSTDRMAIWVTLSLILSTLVFALLVTEATLGLLQLLQLAGLSEWTTRYGLDLKSPIDSWFVPPLIVLTVGVSLGWIFGLRPFFQKYMGDVVQWATYHETSKGHAVRRAILEVSTGVFRHVLEQPKPYDRVVVMAHSLGSVVAHDTLLYLRHDPAMHPSLGRISHIMTYGSPIDKFAYFFEAQQGQTPRYEDTINHLRGSVFESPFKVGLRWENFYEEGDPISGTIHTAGTSAKPMRPKQSKQSKPDDSTSQVDDSDAQVNGPTPWVKSLYTANANTALVSKNHTGYTSNRLVLNRMWDALRPGFGDIVSEETTVDVMAHTRWMRQMYTITLLIPWALLASYAAHGAYWLQQHPPSTSIRWVVAALLLVAVLVVLRPWKIIPRRAKPFAIAVASACALALWATYGPTDDRVWTDQETLLTSLNRWAIGAGIGGPLLVTLSLLAFTNWQSRHANGGKATRQTSESQTPLLIVVLAVLGIAVVVTTMIHWPDGAHALLPWWWWRLSFLYGTFTLIAITGLQVVFASRVGHMLDQPRKPDAPSVGKRQPQRPRTSPTSSASPTTPSTLSRKTMTGLGILALLMGLALWQRHARRHD